MSLAVADIVNVTILVAPTAPQARGFGTLLFMGGTNTLTLEDRIHAFTTAAGVAADPLMGAEEIAASTVYFAQQPSPPLLFIGRRFSAAVAGHLRGSSAVTQVLASYTAITNGGFDVAINGTNRQVTALNLSGAASMTAVAALVQTSLAALVASTTCTWVANPGYFLITSPTTGVASVIGFGAAPTGGGSPVDVSTLFGFTQASGATSVTGIALETMSTALTANTLFNPNWYGLAVGPSFTVQDNKDSMAFAEANKDFFVYSTSDPNCLLTSDTTNLGYYAKNLGLSRSFGQYSTQAPYAAYAAVSAFARLAVVDFSQPNSTITLMFKQEPLVGIEPLTETQKLALDGFNLNYYASFGNFAMLSKGRTANGRAADEVQGLDWLGATLQNDLFTYVATNPTKVPLTDVGAAGLVQTANKTLAQAKNNGLVAPGTWNGQTVGEKTAGDLLPLGYYTYPGPVSAMSASDRAARKSPPITSICVGAGAIESVALTVVFQR